MKKRVLITGSRHGNDLDLVHKTFQRLMPYLDPRWCLINGRATGYDFLGKQWAMQRGVPVLDMEANWKFYGRKAGSLRNQWMLDYGLPDLLIAFPGGVGTQDMVSRSLIAKLDICYAV